MPVICCLCEEDLQNVQHLQCTSCTNFNGDPFVYCLKCVEDRKAVVAHQANSGENHLFKLTLPPEQRQDCYSCSTPLRDTTRNMCAVCSFSSGFYLCSTCSRPGILSDSKPKHEHLMIPVSANGVIMHSHIRYLKVPEMSGRWCDGCLKKPIVGWGMSCTKCYNAFSGIIGTGYDLCAKCADEERGAYLHDRWNASSESHKFKPFRGSA